MHYALKANSTLAIVAAAARPRQRRRRQLRRRDRRRAARRLHPAARSSSPASARRDAELAQADRPRRQDDQRRVGGRARSHRRDRRATGRRARASPSASIPTSTRAAIRTSRPASRPTSSASRSTTARDLCRRMRGRSRSRDRRPAHARRLADHGPRAAAPRAPARSWRWRRSWPPTACAIEHLDLGGGLGISYDGTPAPTARRIRRRDPADRSASTGLSLILEPGRHLVGPAGALADARGRRRSRSRAAS